MSDGADFIELSLFQRLQYRPECYMMVRTADCLLFFSAIRVTDGKISGGGAQSFREPAQQTVEVRYAEDSEL